MANKRKIGIMIDNLHLGIRDGIRKAKELGVDGVQVYCVGNELEPDKLSRADRAEFKKFVADAGLEISALCGDIGKGFLKAELNQDIVARSKKIVDLAVDLGMRVITSHIGHLPDNEHDPSWAVGLEAFDELGAYAENHGCVFAMETGPEEPAVLRRFLDKIGNKGVGVNYDPANLIMCGPYDHIGGVRILRPYIVHTHAKDAVRLLSEKTVGGDVYKRRTLEVPLGQGSVAFRYYLWALDEIGYQGYLTIEREGGKAPVTDVAEAVRFLRALDTWNGLIFRRKEGRDVKVEIPPLS